MSLSDSQSASTNLPSPPQLPVEIWDRVIDFLSVQDSEFLELDRPTLVLCSLVCRAWLIRCRFLLCADVTLRSARSVASFSQCLSTSPQLCPCINHLTIGILGPGVSPGGDDEDLRWMATVPLSLPIRDLKGLKVLHMDDFDLRGIRRESYECYSLFRPIHQVYVVGPRYDTFKTILDMATITGPSEFYVMYPHYAWDTVGVDFGPFSLKSPHLQKAAISLSRAELRILMLEPWEIDAPELVSLSVAAYGPEVLGIEWEVECVWRSFAQIFRHLCEQRKTAAAVEVSLNVDRCLAKFQSSRE